MRPCKVAARTRGRECASMHVCVRQLGKDAQNGPGGVLVGERREGAVPWADWIGRRSTHRPDDEQDDARRRRRRRREEAWPHLAPLGQRFGLRTAPEVDRRALPLWQALTDQTQPRRTSHGPTRPKAARRHSARSRERCAALQLHGTRSRPAAAPSTRGSVRARARKRRPSATERQRSARLDDTAHCCMLHDLPATPSLSHAPAGAQRTCGVHARHARRNANPICCCAYGADVGELLTCVTRVRLECSILLQASRAGCVRRARCGRAKAGTAQGARGGYSKSTLGKQAVGETSSVVRAPVHTRRRGT